MKCKTVLVPLTMPLLLAACFGSSSSSGSSWRNFTSFENINPNQRIQFQSGGGSVNYAGTAAAPGGLVGRDGVYSNEGARLRVRYGPDTSDEPDFVEFGIDSAELTVNLPDGAQVVRTFDGDNVVPVVGAAFDEARIFALDDDGEPIPGDVTDRLYAADVDAQGLEYMTYGLWELGLDGTERNIGGAAFGALTRVSGTDSMPTLGTARYDGELIGYNVIDDRTRIYVADSRLDADFDLRTVEFRSTGTQLLVGVDSEDPTRFNILPTEGTITGNTFSGSGLTIAALPPTTDDPPVPTGGGSFGGAFFGPEAAEAGGWFEMRNLGNSDRYFGSFGGQRGAIDVPEP